MTLPVEVFPGPADHSTARRPFAPGGPGGDTGGFCVTPVGAGATAKFVPVAFTEGGAPGPTCETRSRNVPSQCRGMSVPETRFEKAMYSTFSNVSLFAKLPGFTAVEIVPRTPGADVTFSS